MTENLVFRPAGPEDAERLARARVLQLDEEELHPAVDILPAVQDWYASHLADGSLFQLLAEEGESWPPPGGYSFCPCRPAFLSPPGALAIY